MSACFYEMQHPGLVYRDNSLEPGGGNNKKIVEETIVEIDENELETEESSKTEKSKYRDGSCLINLNCKIEFHTSESFAKEMKFDRLGENLTTYCSIVGDQNLLKGVLEKSTKVYFETPSYLYDLKGDEFEKNWKEMISGKIEESGNGLKLEEDKKQSELKDYVLYC